MPQQSGPSIRIGSKDYDVNKDFTWRELLTVEELAGVPLARDGAYESFSVLAAFVFVVIKREDDTLMWEGFLDRNINELIDGLADDGPEDEPDAKPAAKRRPTKPAA